MRCLFCGKELALLKRLRGGGEFCSEAHRKEYQEQYEQLALARLLQAKPADAAGQISPSPVNVPENSPRTANAVAAKSHVPAPAGEPSVPAVALIESATNPEPATAALESDPAPLGGFLADSVVPAVNPLQPAATLDLKPATTPSLPAAAAGSGAEGAIPPVAPLDVQVSIQALDQHIRANERGVGLREFAGPAPIIELHLQSVTGIEPAGEAETMEISMTPHPPQKASPWLGPARPFGATPVQLGELARLDFAAIGFAYTDIRLADQPAPEIDSHRAVPAPIGTAPEVVAQTPPESVEASVASPPAPVVEAVPEPEPAPPALVTKALPVTLHGLGAARGKFAQPFGTIAVPSDVHIPASTALPLRPMIVFGPAPAAPTLAPVPETPKAAPKQEKPTQPESTPAKRPSAPLPETAAKTETKSKPKPEPKPEPAKADTPAASVSPAKPVSEKPAPQAVADSAIPSLRLEATESAWSKLSGGLKIGIAAGAIAAIVGVGFLVTRGSKPVVEAPVTASSAPSAVAGVPISGGWIDDWANAAKSKRHVSLLSGSAKLSDYRMEFQAQIESKAIGWIFRGLNPRNYYVAKLETITPGLEPTVALVHFAVVDGQDEPRVVVPLPMKSRVDTTYKIRFDAVGNRFTVWVQDQQVAEWSDSRFGSGGVGFFSDRDEKAAMQGPVNVVALVPKN